MEVGMLAWVMVGLRLKRIPLCSLLGAFSFSIRSIALDLCAAAVFWIGSLIALSILGLTWSGVETALAHRSLATHVVGQAGPAHPPDQSQLQTLHALMELAPANGREIVVWTFLCVLVGFVEEIVFRGYFQRQFIGWAGGCVGVGVLISAAVFGGAHAYQGVRGMALLTAFGVLFSLLALNRRSLRAGMFAHGWHDLIAGLALAFLHSSHVI
jgi:hypothetical protein